MLHTNPQKIGPLSMKSLLRTKNYLGVISMGRLILYRESTPSDEKEFKQLINLQGPNITSEVQSDHKNEKRFTLIVHAGHKNETFDVSAT